MNIDKVITVLTEWRDKADDDLAMAAFHCIIPTDQSPSDPEYVREKKREALMRAEEGLVEALKTKQVLDNLEADSVHQR